MRRQKLAACRTARRWAQGTPHTSEPSDAGRSRRSTGGASSCGQGRNGLAGIVAAGTDDHMRAAIALHVQHDSVLGVDQGPDPSRSDENLRAVRGAIDGEHWCDLSLVTGRVHWHDHRPLTRSPQCSPTRAECARADRSPTATQCSAISPMRRGGTGRASVGFVEAADRASGGVEGWDDGQRNVGGSARGASVEDAEAIVGIICGRDPETRGSHLWLGRAAQPTEHSVRRRSSRDAQDDDATHLQQGRDAVPRG
jgi:hypothetical protein